MKSGERILIVDDEKEWRDALQESFQDGYRVDVADNHSAKEVIDKNAYDFVILDIMMKGKDGKQVFEELRAVDQHCVVAVLSVLTADDEKVRWFRDRNIRAFSKNGNFGEEIKSYLSTCEFKEPKDISALVVDDDRHNRDTYADLLREKGVGSIELCASLEEAEQKAAARTFDIYIVDICFREQGTLIPKGQGMVSLLLQNGHCERGVAIPISTEGIAKDILSELSTHRNVRPFFYDRAQPEQFAEWIEGVLERGPFMVHHG